MCALSWLSHNEAVLRAAKELQASGNSALLRYEDVEADPVRAMEAVADATDLPWTNAWGNRELPVVISQTAPDPEKWRDTNRPSAPSYRWSGS